MNPPSARSAVAAALAGALLALAFGASSAARAGEAPAVTSQAIADRPFVANLHLPAQRPGALPGVVLLGGSGGGIGWQDEIGALLAGEGFATLALAYFGMEGLPAELEEIPLEYFAPPLDYLVTHPAVDAERIGLVGVSKGGELALLLASREPRYRAVVAFVPSGVVFQSIAEGWPRTSSWSLGGEGIPFVPYAPYVPGGTLADLYRRSVEQATDLEAATIPVEKIAGPVLLLSGRADTLWPSSLLSERVVERLAAKGFAHPYEHVAYDDAGHLISRIRDDASRRGGTDEGNATAQRDAQRRMLEFLKRYLAPPAAEDR